MALRFWHSDFGVDYNIEWSIVHQRAASIARNVELLSPLPLCNMSDVPPSSPAPLLFSFARVLGPASSPLSLWVPLEESSCYTVTGSS